MAIIAPAQQITANGQQLTFNPPPGVSWENLIGVLIFNKSPYELQVFGGAGVRLVPANWKRFHPLAAATPKLQPRVQPSPLVLTAMLAPGVPVPSIATVYVEWLQLDDDFDSGPLPPDTGVSVNQNFYERAIATVTGSTATATVTIPSWAGTMRVFPPITAGTSSFTVTGTTTGLNYRTTSVGTVVDLAPALDPSVTITWTNPPATWYVIAINNYPMIWKVSDIPDGSFSNAGPVALLTTGVTTIIAAPTAGFIYLMGVTLYAGASASGVVGMAKLAAGTPWFDTRSAAANSDSGREYPIPYKLVSGGGNATGLYVPTQTVAGLNMIARYSIGND